MLSLSLDEGVFLNFYSSRCNESGKRVLSVKSFEKVSLKRFSYLTHERIEKFSKELESVWGSLCPLHVFFLKEPIIYLHMLLEYHL